MEIPNIAQYFPHLQERVMPHSLGQPVLSDWADMPDDHELKLYKNCGMLNRDEAAILYAVAKTQVGLRLVSGWKPDDFDKMQSFTKTPQWLDIGAHTGWTALHMAAAGAFVTALEPMFGSDVFRQRFVENLDRSGMGDKLQAVAATSRMYFGLDKPGETPLCQIHHPPAGMLFDGVMIDGDHCWGHPLYDAIWAYKHLDMSHGVILLHDFIGGPVREAVRYLMCEGMKCRVYCASSQLLAVCWRGEFTPPEYTPDPRIDWKKVLEPLQAQSSLHPEGRGDFYFEECS